MPELPPVRKESNPENNQPPLFYFLVGMFFRLMRMGAGGALSSPELRLLGTRLLCVAMLVLALALPLRKLASQRPPLFAVAGLLVLLLPGASEALVRCANEAPVFLWSSVAICLLERRASAGVLALTLAIGPLLKLTALPVVAFVVVVLWVEGRKRAAILGALCATAVFPVQLLRGWRWGGTLELNRPAHEIAEPILSVVEGLGRSIYVFVKTAFWLGGSSFFKAPVVLVAAYFGLIVAWLLLVRSRRPLLRLVPHAAGGIVAMAGFLTFAMANRRFYGVWGGVGGGYVWTWVPWLLVAAPDLGSLPARSLKFLLAATAMFVVVANAVYYTMAFRLYG